MYFINVLNFSQTGVKFLFDLFLDILYFVEIIYIYMCVFSFLIPLYRYMIYFYILVVYPAI